SNEEDASEEEDNNENWSDDSRKLSNRILWPMKTLARRSRVVEQLVAELLQVCQKRLSKSFFPELQPAIGVGSAFEGWGPDEEEADYYMLMPLKPPRGHSFHLELGDMGYMLARDSRIRVETQCTCTEKDILCFVHTSEDELWENQDPSLLHTMCTNSYLDAEKIALWFQDLVKSVWAAVPQSHHYSLKVLPSCWFCRMWLTPVSGRTLSVVIMFGVQQDNSDIYLSTMPVNTLDPSTTWPQTCVVAEAKFFRFVAQNTQPGSVHLKCLYLCTSILEGTTISATTMKRVVMHYLHQSWLQKDMAIWSKRDFVKLLQDILSFLLCCLEINRMDHFFMGNDSLPEEIILPPDFRTGEKVNVFQRLQEHPHAHASALSAICEL
ncbi:IPIL1 protein, partial [Upupa epops]|nr:IPIL1 protein [Upupa epops]